MLHPELLKQVLPGLVTSVALQYPIAYIRSISFHLHNKIVAACFWQSNGTDITPRLSTTTRDSDNGCYIYHYGENLRDSEVEISGTDESGKEFVISLPYARITSGRAA